MAELIDQLIPILSQILTVIIGYLTAKGIIKCVHKNGEKTIK